MVSAFPSARVERSGFECLQGTLCYVVLLVRHFSLILPLSAQVYKWVSANLMLWAQSCDRLVSHPWGGGRGRNTPNRFSQKPG